MANIYHLLEKLIQPYCYEITKVGWEREGNEEKNNVRYTLYFACELPNSTLWHDLLHYQFYNDTVIEGHLLTDKILELLPDPHYSHGFTFFRLTDNDRKQILKKVIQILENGQLADYLQPKHKHLADMFYLPKKNNAKV